MSSWQNDTAQTGSANYENLVKNVSTEEREILSAYVGMKKNDFLKRLMSAWEKDKKKGDVFDVFGEKSVEKSRDVMEIETVADAFSEPPASPTHITYDNWQREIDEADKILAAINRQKNNEY